MTSTFKPAAARAAAMLTVVVVLPTPPFWLETVKIAGLLRLGQFAAQEPFAALVLVGELAGDGAGVVDGVQDVAAGGNGCFT